MTPSLGEWLFAFGLALSWANSAMHVALSDRPLYIRTLRILQGKAPVKKALVVGCATVPYLALVAMFLFGRHVELVAVAILLALATIRRFEIAQWPGDIVVRLGKYVPAAACLLAWLISSLLLPHLGFSTTRARALGWDAACGVMGGAHLLAGIAKVRESGWVWMHPRYQSLLVAERAFIGPRLFRGLRWSIANSPRASWVVGVTGMVVEFAAAGFVVQDLRFVLLAVIIILYTGFLVLLGYFELEWMVVLTAITLLAS